ncbi:MAG: hypothetical protein RL712_833, partial [Bacteroidota bacterium]
QVVVAIVVCAIFAARAVAHFAFMRQNILDLGFGSEPGIDQ